MSNAVNRPLAGWDSFKFGMDFNAVLSAQSKAIWNRDSFLQCLEGMHESGCTLTASDQSEASMIAGVALLPSLIFNQEAKLAAIRLGRFLRGNVNHGQCESVYAMLYDQLHEEWGASSRKPRDRRQIIPRRTPKGHVYTLGTHQGATFAAQTFHVLPDGRGIDLRFDLIGAATPANSVCHISITYRGPISLQPSPHERPYPLKNWQ